VKTSTVSGRVHEDNGHLFFSCNLSVQIWSYLQIDWSVVGDLQQTAVYARRQFSQPFFTAMVLSACWNIWKIMNGFIF
jgi:hypothetical protein